MQGAFRVQSVGLSRGLLWVLLNNYPSLLAAISHPIARLDCNRCRMNPRCIIRIIAAISERKPPRTVDSGAVFLITMDCPVFEPFV